jgi:hypothetical protein
LARITRRRSVAAALKRAEVVIEGCSAVGEVERFCGFDERYGDVRMGG